MVVYTQEYIQEKLKKELEAEFVSVEDLSDGCGAKFKAVVVTKKFEGVPPLQRQRMVYGVIKKEMEDIHAFSQTTLTPEQWEKQNQPN